MKPSLPFTIELPQTGPTREHLRQAQHHLDLARELLDRAAPEYRAAAAHVVMCYQRALSALTTWNRTRLPEGAGVRELAPPAIHSASILRTPVGRALAVLPTLRTVGGKKRLDVHDREDVEASWYTARNLYRSVAGELPACVRSAPAAPFVVPTESRPAGRRREVGIADPDQQARKPASTERSAPVPLATRS